MDVALLRSSQTVTIAFKLETASQPLWEGEIRGEDVPYPDSVHNRRVLCNHVSTLGLYSLPINPSGKGQGSDLHTPLLSRLDA